MLNVVGAWSYHFLQLVVRLRTFWPLLLHLVVLYRGMWNNFTFSQLWIILYKGDSKILIEVSLHLWVTLLNISNICSVPKCHFHGCVRCNGKNSTYFFFTFTTAVLCCPHCQQCYLWWKLLQKLCALKHTSVIWNFLHFSFSQQCHIHPVSATEVIPLLNFENKHG